MLLNFSAHRQVNFRHSIIISVHNLYTIKKVIIIMYVSYVCISLVAVNKLFGGACTLGHVAKNLCGFFFFDDAPKHCWVVPLLTPTFFQWFTPLYS